MRPRRSPAPSDSGPTRTILYGCVGACVMVYLPSVIPSSLTHPCASAHYGWRRGCVMHSIAFGMVDWVAVLLNLASLGAAGYAYRLEVSRSTNATTRAVIRSVRTGFLTALMSFSYVVQHGAHLALRKDSLARGFLFIVLVLLAGIGSWNLGWWLASSTGGAKRGRAVTLAPFTSSTETGAILSFLAVSCVISRGLYVPMDPHSPDFVRYGLNRYPGEQEMFVNIVLVAASLVLGNAMPPFPDGLGFLRVASLNAAACLLVVAAYHVSVHTKGGLDAAFFVPFVSVFCGCLSNFQGIAEECAGASRRWRRDGGGGGGGGSVGSIIDGGEAEARLSVVRDVLPCLGSHLAVAFVAMWALHAYMEAATTLGVE